MIVCRLAWLAGRLQRAWEDLLWKRDQKRCKQVLASWDREQVEEDLFAREARRLRLFACQLDEIHALMEIEPWQRFLP